MRFFTNAEVPYDIICLLMIFVIYTFTGTQQISVFNQNSSTDEYSIFELAAAQSKQSNQSQEIETLGRAKVSNPRKIRRSSSAPIRRTVKLCLFKNRCLCWGKKVISKGVRKNRGNFKRHHQCTREEEENGRQFLGGKTKRASVPITWCGTVLLEFSQSCNSLKRSFLFLQSFENLRISRQILLGFLVLFKVDATKQFWSISILVLPPFRKENPIPF